MMHLMLYPCINIFQHMLQLQEVIMCLRFGLFLVKHSIYFDIWHEGVSFYPVCMQHKCVSTI